MKTMETQNQKLEILGAMASGIAHDFNNLLQPILGFASMGLRKTAETEDLHNYFNGISTAANRARDLIEQIQVFSPNNDPDLNPSPLQSVIREIAEIQSVMLPENIQLERDIDENCPWVMADTTGMHQLLMNLTTNAIHALQENGGQLKISLAGGSPPSENHPSANPNSEEFACLTVADTGEGIDPDIMDKIFEPFFTTREKSKGTGLGLSIVSSIVNKHRGILEVASTPGQGTSFTVYLPIAKRAPPVSIGKARCFTAALGTEKILLVDDDESPIRKFTETLSSLGYQVTGICGGDRAWEIVRGQPGEFDLVVTDMQMPGMSGYELAVKILDIRPDMPILLCSANPEPGFRKNATAIGIRECLTKPIDPASLPGIIRNHLD
jgi:CheY-like chemotaxis protein/two-component sensor histidine kinase